MVVSSFRFFIIMCLKRICVFTDRLKIDSLMPFARLLPGNEVVEVVGAVVYKVARALLRALRP